MLKEERILRLAEYIEAQQYANFDELIRYVGASKATVRRDLMELCEMGKITFVRGGAAAVQKRAVLHESVYHVKEMENSDEKRRIGEAAASLIQPGDTVFISPGTTTRMMVESLKRIPNLNLVTNDIMIAMDLYACENINITITGGQLRTNYYTLRGYAAESFLRSLKVDIAFMSCDAIDLDSGCYISNADEVGLLKTLIKVANRTVMLCDHSKFGANAFVSFCRMEDLDHLISGKELDAAICTSLSKLSVELRTV